MVSFRLGRRGASMLGCLLSVVLFLGALYYGAHIGGVYWRYYELLDDMQQQAKRADQVTDDVDPGPPHRSGRLDPGADAGFPD